MKIKMVYKKSESFITIISNLLNQDDDYVYLECGKYLRSNIVSWMVLSTNSNKSELKDDA